MEKNRTVVLIEPKSTFSDAHISGAKKRCPLKISQLLVENKKLSYRREAARQLHMST